MLYSYISGRNNRQNGVSLIIVLVMLIVIGLTSVSAMKRASSSERATNNIRMQNLAQQYAEAALRYCEDEIAKADGSRTNTLKNANVFNDDGSGNPVVPNYPPSGWNLTASWLGGGGAISSLTSIPSTQITAGDSAYTPNNLPQCVAERSRMPDGNNVTVITARGFSPDYAANNVTGETTAGSVVWLQSILGF